MKALLDEHLSSVIALTLRARGLDVEAVVERRDLIGHPDDELLDIAHAEARAMVTGNVKDFRPLAAGRVAEGRGHAGLILLPPRRERTRAAAPRLAAAIEDMIEDIMRAHPSGLANGERWLPPPSATAG